ncbi:MAG TPA: rhombotarget lipoprotein [Syntrophorhabdaceae bacterium]|nr:rhombotarget lipoprotein [Syntrophorhabdaceae bacterium]HQM81033.1 rhombotarget lipoprotein [Syntrophorhabdaceae bacterium]
MDIPIKSRFFLIVVASLCVLAGCSTATTRTHSSVVQYLYPDKEEPVETSTVPTLTPPVKVGIAFVPELMPLRSGKQLAIQPQKASPITEQEKMALLKEISDDFTKYPFISKPIEIIPSQYLTPGGSFRNLDQIRSMYGVDIIALLSYDQAQFTDEGFLTLTYWTLVGAYVVKGEKNSTSTMMDTAVYHIPSRKMLFRAPGVSNIKGSSTPVNLSEQLREDAHKGFKEAAANLIENLHTQLQLFRDRMKSLP